MTNTQNIAGSGRFREELSAGKVRGLDTLSDSGVFCVLAIDHRDSFRAAVPNGENASADQLTQAKLALIRGVGARASGVMLEPELSLPQAITSGALSARSGFMAALEAQGYLQDPWSGPTELLDGWSATQAQQLGASAAKLLLPYDPDRSEHAAAQRAVVGEVAEHCAGLDLALLVEPVCFGMSPDERPDKVLRSVQQLTDSGLDVLKLEFPGNPDDPSGWAEACASVDAAATVPWVLLSSGVTFEQYRDQLAAAFAAGCSGFTGGRAIWRPMVEVAAADRDDAIAGEVVRRFEELVSLAQEHARPWDGRQR